VTKLQRGSFRLFQLAGIEVFLHWSWFIVAVFAVVQRRDEYSSYFWNAAEYVALFAIVLMHEFGHALACRQVGGQANRIILWPLGGVAFVSPPQRPGATLWSIAAGPLVNAILLPIALAVAVAFRWSGLGDAWPDLQRFLWMMVAINVGLLMFNLLPIFPLDGGQILRALLWFFIGRARSLKVAAAIGLLGALGLLILSYFVLESVWAGIMAFFILMMCWRGWKHAGILSQLEKMPVRPEFACPVCRMAPPIGPLWRCHHCGVHFDTFATRAICPRCGVQSDLIPCVHCGAFRSITDWESRS
jgi:Zn-dependent protease